MTHQDTMTRYLESFIDGLVDSGMTHAVISPGSRSTPLALLLYRREGIETFVDVDERSAGFFALGLSKASHRPVALVCTSGTAAANYFPAICEAKASGVPLVVLTTDRPHELRQVGAAQTIDQLHLYHEQVIYFTEMAIPEDSPKMLDYVFWQGRRLPSIANGLTKGPVHANLPLREPLLPSQTVQFHQHKAVSELTGEMVLSDEQVTALMTRFSGKKGVIVAGGAMTHEEARGLIRLAETVNWPLIGDPLTMINHCGKMSANSMSHADLFIPYTGDTGVPEVVIRFGTLPVSKQVMMWLDKLTALDTQFYIVDKTREWQDPLKQGQVMIQCEPSRLVTQLVSCSVEPCSAAWCDTWKNWQKISADAITQTTASAELTEMSASRMVHDMMRESGHLFVSNSMSIRYLDRFMTPRSTSYSLLGNRGVNGIDGVVSTALGVVAYTPHEQHVLLVGDLTLYHDMNGLMMAKKYQLPLTIVLLNNNGGGIFSFLSQRALEEDEFNALFGTPVDLDFSLVARLYGAEYRHVTQLSDLQDALEKTQSSPCFQLIEVTGEKEDNVTYLSEVNRIIKERMS